MGAASKHNNDMGSTSRRYPPASAVHQQRLLGDYLLLGEMGRIAYGKPVIHPLEYQGFWEMRNACRPSHAFRSTNREPGH